MGKRPRSAEAFDGKALFRRYIKMWEAMAPDRLPEVVHEAYVGHTVSGNRDFKALVRRMRDMPRVYGSIEITIESQIAEGDLVASRMVMRLESLKDGRSFNLHGQNVVRIEDGLIVEEWPLWEMVPDA